MEVAFWARPAHFCNKKMGDEDQDAGAKAFKLMDDQNQEVAHWRSYNANGSAAYTNGDKYDGDFVKGVTFLFISPVNVKFRGDMAVGF